MIPDLAKSDMQRLRLKADGRIVELRDGQEFPLAPGVALAIPGVIPPAVPSEAAPLPAVRDLRRRARLTQLEFASGSACPWRRSETGSRASARRVDRHGLCSPYSRIRRKPFSRPLRRNHNRLVLGLTRFLDASRTTTHGLKSEGMLRQKTRCVGTAFVAAHNGVSISGTP